MTLQYLHPVEKHGFLIWLNFCESVFFCFYSEKTENQKELMNCSPDLSPKRQNILVTFLLTQHNCNYPGLISNQLHKLVTIKLILKSVLKTGKNIPKRETLTDFELFIDFFLRPLLYNVITIINLFNALPPPCK